MAHAKATPGARCDGAIEACQRPLADRYYNLVGGAAVFVTAFVLMVETYRRGPQNS